MAGGAISRDIQQYVIRIDSCYIITVVATCTVRWRCPCCIISLMAVIACHGCMCTRQRPYTVVIKGRRYPCYLIMAISATGRELLSYVVWICCLIVVISMATGTVRWYCSGIIVALVAVVTTHTCMCTCNGIERVIKG